MTRNQRIAAALLLLSVISGGYVATSNRMWGDRWKRLAPRTRSGALAIVKEANAQGLGVMFYDGWRDPLQQQAKITAGTSKVNDPLSSYHAWGLAVDIVLRNAAGLPEWPPVIETVNGEKKLNSVNYNRWLQLGRIGEKHGFTWGGRWFNPVTLQGFFDGPHFQLKGFDLASLKQQYGTNVNGFLQQQGVTA